MPHGYRPYVYAFLLATGLAAGAPGHAASQAGTVVLAVGTVTDLAADGSRRALHDGDSIYAGDSLGTGDGSYADLDFEDGGRILLRPGTQFQIEGYQYAAAAHATAGTAATAPVPETHESAFFRLIKGGLRAISGLIGHQTRADYRLDTPVATIGIRGTEYEVRYCGTDCAEAADSGGPSHDGLYAGVDRGAIAVSNQAGETITTAGRFLYVRDAHAAITVLPGRPPALRHMRLPERYQKLEQARLKHIDSRRLEERRRLRQQLRLRAHRVGGGA